MKNIILTLLLSAATVKGQYADTTLRKKVSIAGKHLQSAKLCAVGGGIFIGLGAYVATTNPDNKNVGYGLMAVGAVLNFTSVMHWTAAMDVMIGANSATLTIKF